jgi:hypothetical protein
VARRRHDSPDAPGEDSDQGPAPADLLQMWISGRTTAHPDLDEDATAETGAPTEPAAYDEPEAADVDAENAEPEVVEAESDLTEADLTEAEPDVAAVDQPPAADQDWWPSDERTATTDEAAADPSQWWPYAEPTPEEPAEQPEPEPTAEERPAAEPEAATVLEPTAGERVDTAADESLWHDETESEWVASDAEAAPVAVAEGPPPDPVERYDPPGTGPDAPEPPAADSPDVPAATLTESEISAHPARGWASFGAAPTAEDVLDQMSFQGPWSDQLTGGAPVATPDASGSALSATPQTQPGNDPAPQDQPVDDDAADATTSEVPTDEPAGSPEPQRPVPPRGLDMTSTAHWTLDDFEAYIRSQSGNELSEWIGGEPEAEAVPEVPDSPDALVAELDRVDEPETPDVGAEAAEAVEVEAVEVEAVEVEAAEVEAVEAPESPTTAGAHVAAVPVVEGPPPTATTEPAPPREAPSRVRGLLAKMGLSREHDQPEEGPPDSAESAAHALRTEPTITERTIAWPSAPEPAAPPVPTVEAPAPTLVPDEPVIDEQHPEDDLDSTPVPADIPEAERAEPVYDPDATAHYDFVTADFDGPPPWAAEEPPAVEDESSTTEAEPPPAEQPAGAHVAEVADDEDHQEWYDDAGLRWTSDDGGYTWFSTDGQGWNAEIGEPIEVPFEHPSAATVVPPATTDVEVTPPAAADGAHVAPSDESPSDESPSDEPEPEPGPEAAAALSEHWPEPESHRKAPPEEAGVAPDETSAEAVPDSGADTPAVEAGEPALPQFVEYKPRGAQRPVLGVLFVAAAVFAVVAIFWAVSKGSQAATGIAVGVTGFALAFWWGLLSWTPTIVSINGAILEVARGSDGERFDLRSPELKIDLDDDTASRNWRTTITRPNGTELVIPASAVDTVEFTAIVGHYRAEATGSSQDTDR